MAATTPGRRVAVIGGLVVAVLLVGLAVQSLTGLMARRSEDVTSSFASVRAVDVSLGAGAIRVVGTDEPVGSTATVRWRRTWDWSRPTLSAVVVDGTLRLRSRCRAVLGTCTVSATVLVPRGSAVTAHSSAGSVRASGVDGDVRLDSSAGSVTGESLRSGSVRATSSAGSVRVSMATPAQRVQASSSAGSVDVTVPDDATAYRVDARTSAGSRRIDVRTDPASARLISVSSSAGSVRVAYAVVPVAGALPSSESRMTP